MPTDMFERITHQLIANLNIEPKIIAMDGSGFSSDYADKYYLKIRGYNVKYHTKCHIAIDVDSRLVFYSQAVRGPRHDTKFAIAALKSLKKYNIQYIIADKAYDTKPIRKCINEKIKALDQIPLKSNFKHGWYRRLSQKNIQKRNIFKKKQCKISI